MNNKKIKRQINAWMGKDILKMERREDYLTESGKIFVLCWHCAHWRLRWI